MRRSLALLLLALALGGCDLGCRAGDFSPDRVLAAPSPGAAAYVEGDGTRVNPVMLEPASERGAGATAQPALAVDGEGRLLIPQGHRLARRDAGGQIAWLAPALDLAAGAGLPAPPAFVAVAAMPGGGLVVADGRNRKLHRVDAAGAWTPHADLPPATAGDLRGPRLVPLGTAGEVLLAEGPQLYRVAQAGGAPVPLEPAFTAIDDLAPAPDGGAYLLGRRAALDSAWAWRVTPAGEVAPYPLPAEVTRPVAIAVAGGLLHVGQREADETLSVRRFAADGTSTLLLASLRADDARLGQQLYGLQCLPRFPRTPRLQGLAGAADGTLWAIVDDRLVRLPAEAGADPASPAPSAAI